MNFFALGQVTRQKEPTAPQTHSTPPHPTPPPPPPPPAPHPAISSLFSPYRLPPNAYLFSCSSRHQFHFPLARLHPYPPPAILVMRPAFAPPLLVSLVPFPRFFGLSRFNGSYIMNTNSEEAAVPRADGDISSPLLCFPITRTEETFSVAQWKRLLL